MDSRTDPDFSPFASLFAALSYGIASMAMVFINKAVLMQYSNSMTLLMVQQLATTLLIHIGRLMGYSKSRGINIETAKKLFWVSLFYNGNVAFALASLKGVNIPMYIAIKRLTPLAVLITGFFRGKGRPTTQVTLSVILIAVGVLIAALGDFSFDPYGYSMAFISVFFQTMYLVLVEKSGAEDGLSSIEIMFYNSLLSLPVLIFIIITTGEFPNSVALLFAKSMTAYLLANCCLVLGSMVVLFHAKVITLWFCFASPGFYIVLNDNSKDLRPSNSFSFLVLLALSLVMGIALNYTMFLCTIVNSALTTTIVGVLKGVGSTTMGFFLLGGVQVHALNVTGLVINTSGGLWYSYAKYQEKKLKKKSVKLISDDLEAHRK